VLHGRFRSLISSMTLEERKTPMMTRTRTPI
jgi:hypothetical protein